jgi:hypothetical protein
MKKLPEAPVADVKKLRRRKIPTTWRRICVGVAEPGKRLTFDIEPPMKPDEAAVVLSRHRDGIVIVESTLTSVTVENRLDDSAGFVLLVAPAAALPLFNLPWTRMITSLVHKLKGNRR